ncbi:MAG: formylmethanofuran dehydrogenase subunit C [Candidatus Lokiarchaeota archaeon]|nr:formylmethanofuran dehydrogenase subunit C [Candidatus Lokiarchaeota archaeon]
MAEITLKPKKIVSETKIPIEVEKSITCDSFAGKSIEDIKKLGALIGNEKKTLGDFFDINGEKSDDASSIKIIIDGDVWMVKGIGRTMINGEIIIKGNAGMHLGEDLNGGKITVEGNVDAFCFNEVIKGEVLVKGNAGDYFASATRGNWKGVSGGNIVIEGNVGVETGNWMKGGTLHIKGNAGDFLGAHNQGGIIKIDGTPGNRLGGEMARGKIIVNGKATSIMPSFGYDGEIDKILIKADKKDPSKNVYWDGNYLKFSGDYSQIKVKSKFKGEIYLDASKNKDLIPK